MMDKQNSLQLCCNAIGGAAAAGVDAMVTPCPLCHLNLDAYQPEIASRLGRKLGMPILHITQLVALAVGVSKEALRFQTHIVRPTGLLAS